MKTIDVQSLDGMIEKCKSDAGLLLDEINSSAVGRIMANKIMNSKWGSKFVKYCMNLCAIEVLEEVKDELK